MGKKVGWALLALVALCCAGCVTKSTTTEGDREVLHQTAGAADVVQDKISEAVVKIEEGKPQEARSLLEIGARAGADIQANMKQQLEVHGPPEVVAPYSQEASAKARERSTAEHSESWGLKVMAVVGPIVGVAATIAGMPWISNLFPALTGKIGQLAKAGLQTITAARAVAERNGGSIGVKDLLTIAKERNVTAGVQDLVVKEVASLEKKMGLDFKMKLVQPPESTATAAA